MSDRKYKQKGYQDTGKPEKKEKRPPEHRPRGDQFGPRTPRMVGTVNRARCSNCGKVLLAGFDPNGKCPSCAADSTHFQPMSEKKYGNKSGNFPVK